MSSLKTSHLISCPTLILQQTFFRNRVCVNISKALPHSGNTCVGQISQSKSCNSNQCPGEIYNRVQCRGVLEIYIDPCLFSNPQMGIAGHSGDPGHLAVLHVVEEDEQEDEHVSLKVLSAVSS